MNDGKNKIKKVLSRIWSLPCIDDDLLMLGRDSKRALGLGTFACNDLKKMVYYHSRNQLFNKIPSDKEVTNF